MAKINISKLKNHNSLYELDRLKQKQIKGSLLMNSSYLGENKVRICLSFQTDGNQINNLDYQNKVINSKTTDSDNQVIASPESEVIINGKKY
jgi:hypothetical protein